MTYTPGPWKSSDEIGCAFQISAKYTQVADVHINNNSTRHNVYKEARANATLIAAAPDLLAALEVLVNKPEIHSEDMQRARAAIAKAEGKQ
jgi:hypothetical protein